ncbi:MAG: hypothetical protein EXR93_12175 [Gemmatimonadetes bacterium]|nr:hypothetical protein [Gemmatimonadota bacterium]
MKKRKASEAAPVQVYLAPGDRNRLERLAGRLELSKSDVLRRGMEALERQVSDPEADPILRIIGIAGDAGRDDSDVGYNVAIEHDRYLADVAEADMAEWRKERLKKKPSEKPPRGR